MCQSQGFVAPDEDYLEKLKASFGTADADGNNKIELDEFSALWEALGGDEAEAAAAAASEAASESEYTDATSTVESRMLAKFNKYDTSNSGDLDAEEVHQIMIDLVCPSNRAGHQEGWHLSCERETIMERQVNLQSSD